MPACACAAAPWRALAQCGSGRRKISRLLLPTLVVVPVAPKLVLALVDLDAAVVSAAQAAARHQVVQPRREEVVYVEDDPAGHASRTCKMQDGVQDGVQGASAAAHVPWWRVSTRRPAVPLPPQRPFLTSSPA